MVVMAATMAQQTTFTPMSPALNTFRRSASQNLVLPMLGYPAWKQDKSIRWGEDSDVQRRIVKPAMLRMFHVDKCRNNVDSCHPVKDLFDGKYPGYTFPKALDDDIRQFVSVSSNVKRRSKMQPTYEMFPVLNPSRKRSDGRFDLGESTRDALGRYTNNLYCTSRNRTIYSDISEEIKSLQERERRYLRDHPLKQDASCARVLCHPTPCPMCWFAGRKDMCCKFHVTPQAREECSMKNGNDPGTIQCGYKCRSAQTVVRNGPPAEANMADGAQPDSNNGPNVLVVDGPSATEKQSFGPWCADKESPSGDEEWVLLPHSVESKCNLSCPTSRNSQSVESDGRTSCDCRQGQESRGSPRVPSKKCLKQGGQESQPSGNTENQFYRNPYKCITDVVGTLDKTNAQKRFHKIHPEPVPDPRDWCRYSKRVTFFGFNSSAYR